ncbi:MAG: immunoglobulin domain-containing protein [Verrucomicrobiota bacterium]
MFGLDLQAKTYQLAWDPSASPDVVGYRIYIAELGKDPGEPLAAGMECTKAVELIPGRTYAIRATSVGADDIESEPGDTLTYSCPVELEAAAIVVQPKSAVAARNGSILLEVTAAGASPLRYQWFFNDLALPGQSARTCQISQLQPASQGRYSVVVSNPAGSVRSADAVVTVAEAPVITGGPQSLVADLWAPAVFNVTVGGTGPFGYQWERSGTRLLGANEATLTLPSVGPGDVGAYRVTVTNLSGKAVSGLATLAIRLPPRILSQPQNLSVPQKTPVVLRVRADGDETLAYQWFQNDRPVGSNSSDLVLGAVQTNAAGIYRVVVSNRLGIATSSDISLWVKAPPVITLPAVPAVDEGQPFVITPVLQGWQPMTVRWLKDGRLLPNETNPVLHVSNAQESDGGYYTVEATNMDGTGRSAACSVVIFTAPRFTSLPVSQVVTNGKSIVFSAAARGGAPLSYQWFFEGSAIPKATTPRLTIPGAQLAHEGVYSLTISNRLGTATSPRVSLRVSYPPVITLQPLPLTIAQDASATFVAAATGRGPLSFAWSLNGQTIPGAIGNSFTVRTRKVPMRAVTR